MHTRANDPKRIKIQKRIVVYVPRKTQRNAAILTRAEGLVVWKPTETTKRV